MPKLDPEVAINVVAYSTDLVRRILAVAATRDRYDTRLPAEWGDLFRQEMARLK
jgi:hypothetical protein